MRRYLPEKIDIDKLINDAEASHIKGFHSDYLLWILSEIAEKPTQTSGYVEIHSKHLQSFVHNYKDYLDRLNASGIIELDQSFSHELYSKVRGYKFADEYSTTLTGVDINYLPIVKKLSRAKEMKLQSCRNNKHLLRWFNSNLTIDSDNAIHYLAVYHSEKKKEVERLAKQAYIIKNTWFDDYSEKCLALQQCEYKDPYESYRRAFIAVDRIKEHDYHLSTDSTVNRFHSTITQMPSDFRNFINYDGEELDLTYPSRKALKMEFFRVLYSSNKFLGQLEAAPKRVFQKLFPGIFEYFSQMKRLHPDNIPILLMRWESHAVLQCITKRISKEHPKVPLFTIHDGIATTRENVDLVKSIICEELENLTGYAPMLKYESWNQKNLKYYDKWRYNQT